MAKRVLRLVAVVARARHPEVDHRVHLALEVGRQVVMGNPQDAAPVERALDSDEAARGRVVLKPRRAGRQRCAAGLARLHDAELAKQHHAPLAAEKDGWVGGGRWRAGVKVENEALNRSTVEGSVESRGPTLTYQAAAVGAPERHGLLRHVEADGTLAGRHHGLIQRRQRAALGQ